MLDSVLAWLVLVIPVGLGLVVMLVPEKHEDRKGYTRWRYILGASLILYGGLCWWQQSRSTKSAFKDRQEAIQQTSTQVTGAVTKAVSDQYQAVVKNLTNQIGVLKGQLASQSKDLSLIKGSNIVTGRKPVKVEVTNPPIRQPAPSPVNISWEQKSADKINGKAATLIVLRVSNFVGIPAFLATCDRACETSGASVAGASMAQPLHSTNDPTVAGFVFMLPRPLAPGIDVEWTVVSEDDKPVSIVKVRLLSPSELPESLR